MCVVRRKLHNRSTETRRRKLTLLLLLFLLPLFSLPAPVASVEQADTLSLMGLARSPFSAFFPGHSVYRRSPHEHPTP